MATKIFLKEKEQLDYFAPAKGGDVSIFLKKESRLRCFAFNLGGSSVRNNLNVVFGGKGARAELYGLYIPQDGQTIENNTFLRHQESFCESLQRYYGILTGKSRAIFNGRILVQRRAQKTDAYLESKNVLLDKEAIMLGRPFLEIFADDVKCTHAFSASQLEEDEIFYLQSRGIGKKEAKKILLLALANEIVDKVEPGNLKKNLCEKISLFLGKKLEAKN